MSGSKRISVDEAAWRNAQAAAARLREVNRNLPGMLEDLRRDQERRLGEAEARVSARQDAMDRSLADLSAQTRKMQQQMTRRLQAKAQLLFNELRESTQQLREETRQALDAQETRLQAGLDEERRQREQDFQSLRDDLAGIQADRELALAEARTLLADARMLYQAIDAQLPHQRFAPGRMAELAPRLASAESNVARGLGEAALAQAQELCLQLSELRAEVELRYQEWQAAQVAATTALTAVLEQIKANESLEVTGSDGKLIDGVTLDVDYWSDGELAALRDRVTALADQVSSTDSQLDVAELRAIVQEQAPELDEQLTAIVGRAGARQFASQVRVNLAELVVTSLEDTTAYVWDSGDATYEGEDPRRAFYAKLVHPDNSEIVVEVAPGEDGETCVLRILSFDVGVPDEEERVSRVHAIARSLRDEGVQISDPAAEPEEPDRAKADLAALRQLAPASASAAPAERRTG